MKNIILSLEELKIGKRDNQHNIEKFVKYREKLRIIKFKKIYKNWYKNKRKKLESKKEKISIILERSLSI